MPPERFDLGEKNCSIGLEYSIGRRDEVHRPGASQVRAGDQPQDRQGAWPRRATDATRPRRRSDRMRPPTSVPGRYCCKNRKSNDSKNPAKVDFQASLPLQHSVAPIPWSVVDFVRNTWSLTSPRTKCISGPGKFCSSPNKDFFNTIGTFRTCRGALTMSVLRGKPEVAGTRSK
jgi:hypothetical protein